MNTPELKASLAKARPLGTAGQTAARPLGKALPLAGAGPHVARETLALSLHFASGTQRLKIQRTIDRSGTGPAAPFRVEQIRHWVHPTSHDKPLRDGRTAIFDGVRFASRRGSGPWRERDTWRGDHHGWLAASYATGELVLRAYAPLLKLSRQGAEDLAGLKVERFTITRNPAVRIKAMDPATIATLKDTEGEWFQWLAATHKPRTVEGTLLRRAGATEVVAGAVTFKGQASVEGTTVAFTLSWSRTLKTADIAKATTTLPKTIEPAHRDRPWFMIRSVVKSELADIYGKRARH